MDPKWNLYLVLGLCWTIEFFTMRISVRLSVTSKEQNKFHHKLPRWGLNLQPLDHQSNALPTELSHYLVFV